MPRDGHTDLPGHVGILVVGAGMAGLTAARQLAAGGRDVLVVDKGWNPGGRMATRVADRARFDHGATFFYPTPGRFAIDLEEWRRDGFAGAWEGLPIGEALWRGTPDMRSLGSRLARGLSVATRTRLIGVGREAGRWMATVEGGGRITADALVMTPPIPQTVELLAAGGFRPDSDVGSRLGHISYARCLVTLAELEDLDRIPAPGFLEPGDGPVARMVDEQAKGTSPVPAVTLHASPEFSRSHWESDRDQVSAAILHAVEPWLGNRFSSHQIHGWRYSRPVSTWPEPCLVLEKEPPLVLAGDAFGGPDVPGAHCSGLAAAKILAEIIPPIGDQQQ